MRQLFPTDERGSFLVEGVLATLALSLFFMAFVRFGEMATERMHRQSEANQRLWYAIVPTPWGAPEDAWRIVQRGPVLHVEEISADADKDSQDIRSIRVGLRRRR